MNWITDFILTGLYVVLYLFGKHFIHPEPLFEALVYASLMVRILDNQGRNK